MNNRLQYYISIEPDFLQVNLLFYCEITSGMGKKFQLRFFPEAPSLFQWDDFFAFFPLPGVFSIGNECFFRFPAVILVRTCSSQKKPGRG